MVVTIGRITATCPVCKGTQFRCSEAHPTSMDVMSCEQCSTKVTYGFLTAQITEKSIAESEAAIKASRARKRPDD